MAVTELLNNNEEYIKDAISNGISADAVSSTLGDILNKSDEIGRTPKQAKEAVETIVAMKNETENIRDERYATEFVKENNTRITSALNDGISPNEVAHTLIRTTEKANDRRTKRRLKFVTKLVSKMKIKELNLRKKKESTKGGIQKVLSK